MIRRKRPVRRHGPFSFLMRYFRLLRFYLVTGLLVWVPLIVTVWLTWWLFKTVGIGVDNLIKQGFTLLQDATGGVEFLAFLQNLEYRFGFGFLVAFVLFLFTGIFARNLIGRRSIRYGERILHRIPLIRNVYRAVQQIRDVFVSREGAVFQKVCIVEYPRKDIYAVGFITSQERGVVQEALDTHLVAVFVPTTPNPTSGFLLYLRPDQITPMDISVEEAMKLIVSGGAYLPNLHGVDSEPALPAPRRA